MVYVDSGSTDGSVMAAQGLGCHIVELDTRRVPFTAARARNAGFARLVEIQSAIEYVQFIDGDCQLATGWLENAARFLDAHSEVAVVCGRRRERFPDQSVYNLFCENEWNTPIGKATACGGDALMRASILHSVGGYRGDLIAGEEPELCLRLRKAGWAIWRIDCDMSFHDANMTRLNQWWRRTVRSGYGFAQCATLTATSPERLYAWESLRAWLWVVGIPLGCLSLGAVYGQWGWASWAIYPIQILRQTLRNEGSLSERAIQASFQMLARAAEVHGQARFLWDRFRGKRAKIIEYK
jgi:glycosyltransferase involved in cell wall biosynthesis